MSLRGLKRAPASDGRGGFRTHDVLQRVHHVRRRLAGVNAAEVLVLRQGAVRVAEGGQVSDFFALAADDHDEWFSSGRTIDYRNGIYVSTGDILYSNRSRPMATVVADTCGRHDVLLTPFVLPVMMRLFRRLEPHQVAY